MQTRRLASFANLRKQCPLMRVFLFRKQGICVTNITKKHLIQSEARNFPENLACFFVVVCPKNFLNTIFKRVRTPKGRESKAPLRFTLLVVKADLLATLEAPVNYTTVSSFLCDSRVKLCFGKQKLPFSLKMGHSAKLCVTPYSRISKVNG